MVLTQFKPGDRIIVKTPSTSRYQDAKGEIIEILGGGVLMKVNMDNPEMNHPNRPYGLFYPREIILDQFSSVCPSPEKGWF